MTMLDYIQNIAGLKSTCNLNFKCKDINVSTNHDHVEMSASSLISNHFCQVDTKKIK